MWQFNRCESGIDWFYFYRAWWKISKCHAFAHVIESALIQKKNGGLYGSCKICELVHSSLQLSYNCRLLIFSHSVRHKNWQCTNTVWMTVTNSIGVPTWTSAFIIPLDYRRCDLWRNSKTLGVLLKSFWQSLWVLLCQDGMGVVRECHGCHVSLFACLCHFFIFLSSPFLEGFGEINK